jgi:DNA-binding NarL/FixJ family response regulator
MNETHIIRVITVDDHEIMRRGIAFSLQAFKDIEKL